MAFVHGKDTQILVRQYSLTSYFNSVDMSFSCDAAETTCYNATGGARTYIAGLKDGTVSLSGLWEGSASSVDAVLQAALGHSTQTLFVIGPEGIDTQNDRVKFGKAEQTTYDISNPVDGVVGISAELQCSTGMWSGVMVDQLAARTGSGNSTAIDQTSQTTTGYVANLHVTAKTGTSPTLDVKIQHSPDNSVWADLATFTQATAETTEQLSGASTTVDRYIRTNRTIGGSSTPGFTYGIAFSRRGAT